MAAASSWPSLNAIFPNQAAGASECTLCDSGSYSSVIGFFPKKAFPNTIADPLAYSSFKIVS